MLSASKPAPRPPTGLSATSRALWRTLCARWNFLPHHLVVLRLALEAQDDYRAARTEITDHGATIKQPSGRTAAHPAVLQMERARRDCARLFAELGLPDQQEFK
jgi:P27 family predicted phage terminase small subunit